MSRKLAEITEQELEFSEQWNTPKALLETLFHDFDNLGFFSEKKFANLRMYQYPLYSDEAVIDFEATANYHYSHLDTDDKNKAEFSLRKNVADIYCFGARKFGKCNSENDLCTLASGEQVKFKDLLNTKQKVISLDTDTLKLRTNNAFFFDNGIKDCYKLTLKSGKEITVTENHPFYSDKGWKPINELKVNDFIATPRKLEIKGNKLVDDNLAKLLGYLLGDGSCTQKTIGFTNINEDIIEEFKSICNFFNCETRKYDISYFIKKKSNYKRSGYKKGFGYVKGEGKQDNSIFKIVSKYGINKLAKNKIIPKEVFKWDNRSIGILLNRLFACDGHISKLNYTIELTLASKELVYQVSTLLLRFGIHSSIYPKTIKLNNKTFKAWRLFIGNDFDKFLDEISIYTKDKGIRRNKIYSTSDKIPNSFILDNYAGFKHKKKYRLRSLKLHNPSRQKCKSLSAVIDCPEITKLVNSHIFWEQIKSIDYVGKLPTVAVQVDRDANYISNNIISHNTLIVEKADLVLGMLTKPFAKAAFSSVDLIHIRQVLDDVKAAFQNHPICKLWTTRITGAPDYMFSLKNGYRLNSVNFNIGAKSPGGQWFGKHVDIVYIEEACVSGRTRISCVDKSGIRKTLRISDLVNNGLWKKYDVFSYNFKAKKLEVKPITKIFKKQVKDYTRYRVEVFCYDSNRKRVIEASKLQKFFTTAGTKYAPELEPGDLIYNKDYQKLNPIQDQIMLGCLLGDASMSKRENCNPSVSFCHGKSQEDYLKYKIEIFKNIFGNNYRVQNKKDLVFNITEKGGRVAHITSDRSVDLKKFITLKNKDNINLEVVKKYFSDISLAFWVMDDGSLGFAKTKTFAGTKYLTLHTEQFKYETVNALCSFLNKRYNVTGRVRSIKRRDKEYFVITFDNDSTRVLSSIIRKYLPYYFYYKVFHSKELCRIIGNDIKFKFEDLSNISYDYLDTYPVIKMQPIKSKTWTMYDVEVKDNHNFFANGLLIHNSLETQEVFDKRKDALSEDGAVMRISGMTNFSTHSPAGRAFFAKENRNHVVNLPQYVSPKWDEKEKRERISQYNGEESQGYKVFVIGGVVLNAMTTFDMERIRTACYQEKKQIKRYEVNKESYPYFKNRIIVERPKNAERIFISADVGKNVAEILVHSEIGENYHYLYNIVLNNLTQQEKEKIFDYLIVSLNANVIALDCGDGEGRGIYSYFEQKYPVSNLVYYAGNKKVEVDFEYNEDGTVKTTDKGEPIYRYEPHSDFSVQRLKKLLYSGRVKIPEDFKFDSQFSVVMGMISGTRTLYKCICESGDHLFDAHRVFAIAQWLKKDCNLTPPIEEDEWGEGKM